MGVANTKGLTLLKFPKKPAKPAPVPKADKSVTSVLNFIKKDVKDLSAIVVVAMTNDAELFTLSNGLYAGEKVLMLERAIAWFVNNGGDKNERK